ncbi:MAG: sulfatase-like hydrolase/transferase [Candidatus Hodarchaeota archaeon]
MDKPNIIFIFSDQQRADTCGCYGQELDVTPNLDKMAEEGVLFENAITCQPVCGPARACLQTGKYATENGCYRNGIALPLDEKTIAHHFTENGYEVGYIGKWHLASTIGKSNEKIEKVINYDVKPVPPERRGGYDDYWLASDILEFTSHGYDGYMHDGDMNKVEFKGYRVDCVTDFVLEYLDSRDGKKPFFLFLSYIEPHHQNDHDRYEGPDGSKEMFKDYKVPGDLEGTEGDWRKNFPDYLGCCWSIDKNVKRIRDKLAELNIANKTVVIYASDHGSHFKTRNSEYKRTCHESAVHVPFIAVGPGFYGGKKITELVSLIDVPPTLLRVGGIDMPSTMRGQPVQDLIDGTAKDWSKEVFIQISESQVGRAIRTSKWKYSVTAPNKVGWLDAKSDTYMEEYLYDLEDDPHEKNNLVQDPRYDDTRRELSEILKKKMKDAGENIPMIIPFRPNKKNFIQKIKSKFSRTF